MNEEFETKLAQGTSSIKHNVSPSVQDEDTTSSIEAIEEISKSLPATLENIVPDEVKPAEEPANEENRINRKRKHSTSGESGEGESDGEKKKKKQRLHWTSELHRMFVSAVNQLGIESM